MEYIMHPTEQDSHEGSSLSCILNLGRHLFGEVNNMKYKFFKRFCSFVFVFVLSWLLVSYWLFVLSLISEQFY